MAQSSMGLRVAQKGTLFTLYKLKKQNAGIDVIGLDNEIVELEAEMEQEDVALVIKKIGEFK